MMLFNPPGEKKTKEEKEEERNKHKNSVLGSRSYVLRP